MSGDQRDRGREGRDKEREIQRELEIYGVSIMERYLYENIEIYIYIYIYIYIQYRPAVSTAKCIDKSVLTTI